MTAEFDITQPIDITLEAHYADESAELLKFTLPADSAPFSAAIPTASFEYIIAQPHKPILRLDFLSCKQGDLQRDYEYPLCQQRTKTVKRDHA